MAGENKTEYKKLYRSVRGTPVAGSLVEGEKFTEARIKEGQFENTVRAYNDNQKKALKDAVEKGEPLFVRGVLGGSKKNDNVHLMVNSVNRPRDIEGEVLFIRRSGEGKAPYAGGFIKKVGS